MLLLAATANAHKLEELRAVLTPAGVELVSLLDRPDLPEPAEDGDTFEANALQKARALHALTGLPTLADDSGLEVDALGGRPGVHSKRYSAEATAAANNAKLLAALQGVTDRRARFRCVLAIVADGVEGTVDGRCEGAIGDAPRGAHGFGYDPLFWPDDAPGRAMAELTMDEKNALSHRGRALAALPPLLARLR